MSFNINVKPKIQLRLKEDFEFNGHLFEKGHIFHVTGDDGMRGYDIEDSEGRRICEIRMIMNKFEEI